MADSADVLILGAKRTAIGRFMGALAQVPAPELGAVALRGVLAQTGCKPKVVEEHFMGSVLQAGLKQGPARQAGRQAGLPDSCPATTLNKLCGSGMQAVILAAERIRAGSRQLVLAGGMESMSRAPYLLARLRAGARLGHTEALDHLFLDGLEDADSGYLMGRFAEQSAAGFGISRAALDDYALRSLQRAQKAQAENWFADEIVPLELGSDTFVEDELPRSARPERITQLEPAFVRDGRITAANASAISDGAAALLIGSAAQAETLGLTPLARIVAMADYAADPGDFCSAPISAIERVLVKANWKAQEVDLYEINEAFALVPLLAMRALKLAPEQVNVLGGACALGHPIGASGARILVTLINALQLRGAQRGVAAICIGGGEATAIALERV